MGIKDWPAAERPREKLLLRGARALSDAELVAIVLRRGVRGRDATEVAREALRQTGGLAGLLELERHELRRLPAFSDGKFAELRAALEISRRYLRAELERAAPITDAAAAENYVAGELKALRREVFGCLFLDTRHRVIDFEILFYGTIDGASVHPREVVKRCLALNAAAAILAHNHPSGDPHPSDADRSLTKRLVKALELVDIRVLDHLVVGRDGCFSFARHGLL